MRGLVSLLISAMGAVDSVSVSYLVVVILVFLVSGLEVGLSSWFSAPVRDGLLTAIAAISWGLLSALR